MLFLKLRTTFQHLKYMYLSGRLQATRLFETLIITLYRKSLDCVVQTFCILLTQRESVCLASQRLNQRLRCAKKALRVNRLPASSNPTIHISRRQAGIRDPSQQYSLLQFMFSTSPFLTTPTTTCRVCNRIWCPQTNPSCPYLQARATVLNLVPLRKNDSTSSDKLAMVKGSFRYILNQTQDQNSFYEQIVRNFIYLKILFQCLLSTSQLRQLGICPKKALTTQPCSTTGTSGNW